MARDRAAAIAALERRRGRGYDPAIVDAALAEPDALLRAADVPDAWERVIDAEPRPVATISTAGLASVARAFGEFADIKLDFLPGHSSSGGRARRDAPPRRSGCSRAEVSEVRAAGFLHDLGRVAVPNGIWDKPGPLSAGEWERVRLHPYYTERVLERSGGARAAGPDLAARITSGWTAPGTTAEPGRRAAERGGAPLGRRRRLRRDDPRSPAPARAAPGGGAHRARRDGPRGGAREAGGGRRARGGGRRAAASAAGLPGRAQRARGRGPAPPRAGTNEQGDREGARDHARRPPATMSSTSTRRPAFPPASAPPCSRCGTTCSSSDGVAGAGRMMGRSPDAGGRGRAYGRGHRCGTNRVMAGRLVNGVRLHHEERGSGAAILCIHGTSGTALAWSRRGRGAGAAWPRDLLRPPRLRAQRATGPVRAHERGRARRRRGRAA